MTLSEQVGATKVKFQENRLHVALNDGREISLPIDRIEWLRWLTKATPDQRANWSLEPGGYAIYWEDLDNRIVPVYSMSKESMSFS
jgi:hypothetical protein